MDRNNSLGRRRKERVNNSVDWCGAVLQELSYFAQDKAKWNQTFMGAER